MAKSIPASPKKKTGKGRKKKRRPKSLRVPLAVFSLVLVAAAAGLVLLSGGGSRVGSFAGQESHRMVRFQDEAETRLDDLRYLTYLDSLFHSDRHSMPTDHRLSPHEQTNTAQIVMHRSGVSRSTMSAWGIAPLQEDESFTSNELMRRLNETGRYLLPHENMPLLFHIRQKQLRPGHLIFGRRLDRDERDGVSFLAVISHVDLIAPMSTTVIYLDDRSVGLSGAGKGVHIVHARLRDCPRIQYYGSGMPGNDLGGVYDKYLRESKIMPW